MAAGHHKSSEVRKAIQTLSCILSNFNLPRVPSEVFRQAKFNKPAASGNMLQLLYHSCELLSQLVKDPYTPRPQLTSNIQPTLESLNERWMLFAIRKFLKQSGYIRNQFYSEQNSRELLLALGWVIFKHGLIIKLRKSVINRSLLPMKQSVMALLDQVETDQLNIQKEMLQVESDLCKDKCHINALHKLVWINGRITTQFKNLNRSLSMYEKLARNIYSYTRTEGKEGLEVYEVYLLRHKESLSRYIHDLEKQLSLLHLFSEWEKLSPVFAKWLISILEMEEEEKAGREAVTDHKSSLSILHEQVQILHSSLDKFTTRNQPFLEYLQSLTLHSKVPHKELEKCIYEVNKETFFVLLKNLNSIGINPKERLKLSVCSFVESAQMLPWLCHKTNELQKQIDIKRSMILQQLQTLQDTVPNTMSITLK